MKKVLVTGSQGFIGSYVCNELLQNNYQVVGVDNFSKYGVVSRAHDKHENFTLLQNDCSSPEFIKILENEQFDYIIAGAAMIGGISYFHKYAYDLLAMNERIISNTFDLALEQYKKGFLKKILVLSSSMVFENVSTWPTKESDLPKCPPPLSTYGFQKLSCEYFARGAFEQYGLPYTIVRPFNCVGVGEDEAVGDHEITSGNIKLTLSHVVPDLILKCLKGQNPLHILGSGNQIRHYTNGHDISRGIRVCLEHENAINNDFNISSSVSTSVLELAQMIWKKFNPDLPFKYVSDPPFEYDVEKRIPDIQKARDILNFEAKITLNESLDEIISWMKEKYKILN
ncbi:NAD(P)-dependent oxidoreductase [Nitrosopumilus sp. b2]|uniref:NAD-dependent epimerase/dehydratase family protein n=1 Tax=Nitrosopumilus sp. b2 TaxID=2109908 RepID=UPI001C7171B5|nr:NAD(P)-dependent oxidoreductase [Nitrosopumilus sp. b2]